MIEDIILLIDESEKIELRIGDIYTLFYNSFPEDSKFWWELAIEEKNHAALIRSGIEFLKSSIGLPNNLLHSNLKDLKDMNYELLSILDTLKEKPPSREEAFNYAWMIENSACEIHYQKFMDKESNTKIDEIFAKLNMDDKDHADRIRAYMIENDIDFNPPEK